MLFLESDMTLKIVSVLELDWNERNELARHRPHHALSYRFSGDADFITDDKSVNVKKDTVIFVPAMCDYKLISHRHEHLIVIHFTTAEPVKGGIEHYVPENIGIFKELFKSALDAWTMKKVGYNYSVVSSLYKILSQLQKQYMTSHTLGASDKMKYALSYIHEHYSEPELTVSHIAEIIGMSETYFRRLFLSALNTTPLKYINELRISYAEELLRSGYYNVTEAAKCSGFPDPKYFSTVMKKLRGFPPSKLL